MDPVVPTVPGAPAPGTVPIDIGADPARELAREELARRAYQEAAPDPVTAGLQWLARRLDELLRAASDISPGGGWGLLVLVAVLVVVVVLVRRRFGPVARTAAASGAVLGDTVRTADEHRRLADRHAAAGAFDDAVRERMRAIVRSLEERTILEPRQGRTAGDAAREGGRVLPAAAGELLEAARRFDETVYGGRPADADTDARLRAVDAAVAATRAVEPA
ncbi:DUF4129 domain-containing protein [Actinomycetospora straminea]|uniref:DUF4129 domain-containing protein n=1 Tax=Actinomycetospora straminea TaxID=663607 RepID=UPI0023663EA8|nr:DUF4129 domain-containing protein [Actinomycetospora straminea]MDD7935235.1 DUF4129 domain-containing protein [Actinomycetospora straminea]